MHEVSIRLMGGLGNQLFQFAFGQRLEALGVRVLYDQDNGFRYDPYSRKYALGVFDMEVPKASPESIPIGMSWKPPFNRIPMLLGTLYPKGRKKVYYERSPFEYDPNALVLRENYQYYFGYWQNPSYLDPVQIKLKQKIHLKEFKTDFLVLREKMRNSPSISVHIRRYNDIDKTGRVIINAQMVHGACTAEYYTQAIKLIPRVKETKAYIFTDDVEWCKEHIRLEIPYQYVSDLGRYSDAEEMMLMASCNHHVISNSTFSWWGAWLGDNNSKKVIAPKEWVRKCSLNENKICPVEWARI